MVAVRRGATPIPRSSSLDDADAARRLARRRSTYVARFVRRRRRAEAVRRSFATRPSGGDAFARRREDLRTMTKILAKSAVSPVRRRFDVAAAAAERRRRRRRGAAGRAAALPASERASPRPRGRSSTAFRGRRSTPSSATPSRACCARCGRAASATSTAPRRRRSRWSARCSRRRRSTTCTRSSRGRRSARPGVRHGVSRLRARQRADELRKILAETGKCSAAGRARPVRASGGRERRRLRPDRQVRSVAGGRGAAARARRGRTPDGSACASMSARSASIRAPMPTRWRSAAAVDRGGRRARSTSSTSAAASRSAIRTSTPPPLAAYFAEIEGAVERLGLAGVAAVGRARPGAGRRAAPRSSCRCSFGAATRSTSTTASTAACRTPARPASAFPSG